MKFAIWLRTLEFWTFLTSTIVREISWLELVVVVHTLEAEPGSPGNVIALGGGHHHEPGAAGGPVGVVVVIQLMCVSSLLQNFADSALRMVSGRIEEDEAGVEMLQTDVDMRDSSTRSAASTTVSMASASSRQASTTTRLTRTRGSAFCHFLI